MAQAWFYAWLVTVGYVWGSGEIGWSLALLLICAGVCGRELLAFCIWLEMAMRRQPTRSGHLARERAGRPRRAVPGVKA